MPPTPWPRARQTPPAGGGTGSERRRLPTCRAQSPPLAAPPQPGGCSRCGEQTSQEQSRVPGVNTGYPGFQGAGLCVCKAGICTGIAASVTESLLQLKSP
eukprot:3935888-Rhodomonas_salina.2